MVVVSFALQLSAFTFTPHHKTQHYTHAHPHPHRYYYTHAHPHRYY
jgi:hypothetical protein